MAIGTILWCEAIDRAAPSAAQAAPNEISTVTLSPGHFDPK
jgi:hypothetical protein